MKKQIKNNKVLNKKKYHKYNYKIIQQNKKNLIMFKIYQIKDLILDLLL